MDDDTIYRFNQGGGHGHSDPRGGEGRKRLVRSGLVASLLGVAW